MAKLDHTKLTRKKTGQRQAINDRKEAGWDRRFSRTTPEDDRPLSFEGMRRLFARQAAARKAKDEC